MYREKAALQKWKADLQAMEEEKRQKNEPKTNELQHIMSNTATFMSVKHV
ncbi:hypothetical protein IGM_01959 [Bacillus cereus HuB4-4]|uniref:Uncharacterized protein n=1 Tax=Bacillus cereus HuB4-4 TaxID=1053211 RepID=A0A9W5QWQ8_BACCE|nr:hypothetical protein [Bacillus cereus]EOP91899.1 hypothetical protein IGM_01959 [Bacillus cereus HuB4-4]